MNKNIKILIAAGGTGGHVIPGYNLAIDLAEKNFEVKLITDNRGYKFLKEKKKIDIMILPSFPFKSKNLFEKLFSLILIFFSSFRSLFFLVFNRPTLIFGMGGYASFPICISAKILNIKFIIYENNLIIGKANRYLLPFASKIFVSNKSLNGINSKYIYKICEIGNILNKQIINFSDNNIDNKIVEKINILVLGGSQAAKVFAEKLPIIFEKCKRQKIPLKIFQHCLPKQNEELTLFYKKNKIDFEIFNFNYDLINYFSRVNIAITRSGSSVLAELTNANIPFIAIPLPTSSDNHQLKNAIFYENKEYGLLVEEKDLNNKLYNIIKKIYEDKSIFKKIKFNQSQHSDKNVYNNISRELEKTINEKN